MARFIRAILICGSLTFASGALAQESSASPASLPVISGHVTPDQFRALASDPVLERCADMQCVTLRALLSSYDDLRRFYTPNTMARSAGNEPAMVRPRLPIQNTAETDPAQRDQISGYLVVISRDVPEWSSELLTIEIATLVDPSGKTSARVVAAIPDIPALDGVVEEARGRCKANRERGCKSIQ